MKVVVTGGRDFDDIGFAFIVLDRIHDETPITLVIHGACGWDADGGMFSDLQLRGADRWADMWAIARGVTLERVPANWTSQGRQAGPIRNGLMLDRKPDMVLAFPGGAGTANCVRQARARGIVVEQAKR